MKARALSARFQACVGVIALATTVVACGSSGGGKSPAAATQPPSQSSSQSPAGSAGSASGLPAKYRSAGINVGTEIAYPPLTDYGPDRKTLVGVDPELMAAIGKKLGVKINYSVTSFDAMIPGVTNGRYDLAIAGFYDTAAREKVVDLVDYLYDGGILLVPKGNPQKLTPDTLCGKKIAANKGSSQASQELPARSKTCQDAGKPAVQAQVFPDTSAAELALASGQVDGYVVSASLGYYVVQQTKDKFDAAGPAYNKVLVGMVVPKGSALEQPLLNALKAVIADGTYASILDKWGLKADALDEPVVNGTSK